jgi:ATP-binding cassette subfamily A (ABC1) protein 3
MIGELNPTSGMAFIDGNLVQKDLYQARRSLGFCPQFDYLPEYLNVEQTFRLYAKLRGIKSDRISQLVNDFINVFRLNEFSDKLVQNLSGGNKRKVSAAISFIGKPSVVILDEPTSGMVGSISIRVVQSKSRIHFFFYKDPGAKRYLWSVITKARDLGITIVLTSHRYGILSKFFYGIFSYWFPCFPSMEECEALCTKIGIMVNGQFVCFGNIQRLKAKFGNGYSLVIKSKFDLDERNNTMNNIDAFLVQSIRNLTLKGMSDVFGVHLWDSIG